MTLIHKPPTSRIAGWTTAGMLDWPGRISVTVFLSGCEFSCPYCHNPQLRQVDNDQDCWKELLGYIHQRRNWIEGVVISGGEPTSDPDIFLLLEEFAAYSIPVKLDCNGSNPDVLHKLIADDLISSVAMDIKVPFDRYENITSTPDTGTAVKMAARMVIESGIAHEFRTTVFPQLVSLGDLPLIARDLTGAALYVLQQFRAHQTLDPAALLVQPYTLRELENAAGECNRFIPTITRGI